MLTEPEEVLLRQVHPVMRNSDGVISSYAFWADGSHNSLLSTRREHIGAQRAFEDWTKDHESLGTWGISVAEVHAIQLSAFDDSAGEDTPEGHASVDYRAHHAAVQRKKARLLRDAAVSRTCLFPPS